MDKLVQTLEKSVPDLNWFAYSEPKQLANEIGQAVTDYHKSPENGSKVKLVTTAKKARDFLINCGSPSGRTRGNQIADLLDEMEPRRNNE